MRMWMVDPRLMCRSHLLGEHKELHMLVGSVRIGRSLRGHIERGQFELASLPARHAALAAEIERRNWNHMSPCLKVRPTAICGRPAVPSSLTAAGALMQQKV